MFSRVEFDRRSLVDAAGLRLYVASAEDTLISKLEWAETGESERRLRDVAGVISTQRGDLDVHYVETWVENLALESRWSEAKRLAE